MERRPHAVSAEIITDLTPATEQRRTVRVDGDQTDPLLFTVSFWPQADFIFDDCRHVKRLKIIASKAMDHHPCLHPYNAAGSDLRRNLSST
jgi:hypothetical protein